MPSPFDPLPHRLHRAASIISRSGDPDAVDAQSACAEAAARIVVLEEAVLALLQGDADARSAGGARWLGGDATGTLATAGRGSSLL